MRLSLGKKISFSTITTILFFGALATIVVFISVQRVILDVKKEGLVILVNETTNEINRVLLNSSLVASTIAKQQEVQDYFSNPVEQDGEILKILTRYNIGDNFSAIYLLSREGKTLVSTDPIFVGEDYSFRRYFTEALAGESFIDVGIGVTSEELGYYLSVPVKSFNDEILGVAVVKLMPEAISNLIHTSKFTKFGHVMLTDDFGVVIYSDVKERIYKSLGGLGPFKRRELDKLQKYSENPINALDYDILVGYFEEGRQSGVVEIYDKYDKNQEILAFSQVANHPFYLIYEEEAKNFSSSAINVSLILSLIIIITAIMTTLVSSILIKRILLPLSDIMIFLRKVESGNLKNKLIIDSDDELSDLANVFNDMIDSVKKEKENVENKIIKRTKDLEKFNKLMVGREVKMIELKNELEKMEKGMRETRSRTWAEKFKEAIEYEEGLIRDLESVYLYKLKMSDLSVENKEKVVKLLKKLVSDSRRHDKMFIKLAQEDE